jgi:uncharacterized SAM-binding protein YcdF (DUF218 family)
VFFQASKLFWLLATPSNFLTLAALAGALLGFTVRFRRLGLTLATSAIAATLVAGLSPVSTWIIVPLEERFPVFRDDGRPVDGVVVLGGSVQVGESLARGQVAINEAGERIIALADLVRRYPGAKVVLAGGYPDFIVREAPEADVLAQFTDTLGIPADRVMFEGRSRTTRENAVFSRRLAQPKPGERWLLVTSAWHMPRAVGSFRSAGFPVTAYPVDYRTSGWSDADRFFLSVADGLKRLETAVKEWLGLVGYRLAGYTDEVFPGPKPEDAGRVMR